MAWPAFVGKTEFLSFQLDQTGVEALIARTDLWFLFWLRNLNLNLFTLKLANVCNYGLIECPIVIELGFAVGDALDSFGRLDRVGLGFGFDPSWF